MHIAVLTLRFHLEGCRSLKEKRQRLAKLRDRFGRMAQIAVCESDWADRHDRAEWSFVIAAARGDAVEASCRQIENYAAEELDAVLFETLREQL